MLPTAESAWKGRSPVARRACTLPLRASMRTSRFVWSGAQIDPAAAPSSPTRGPIVTLDGSAAAAAANVARVSAANPAAIADRRPSMRIANYRNLVVLAMADTGPETILFDVFLTN